MECIVAAEKLFNIKVGINAEVFWYIFGSVLGKETIDLYNTSDTRGTSQSYGLNYQKTGKDMPYLFVKSWLPKTKINRTGTRSASNSANHVFFISFNLVQFCTSEK